MSSKRFVLLDGFRGLAAIYVVMSHVAGESFPALYQGNLRVDFFFVLSGFVLQNRVPKSDAPGWSSVVAFLRMRFFRIWPMLITVLIARLVIWGLWSVTHPSSEANDFGIKNFPTSFLAALLLLQIFVPVALEWSDPLWSLSAEWFMNIWMGVTGTLWAMFGFKSRQSLSGSPNSTSEPSRIKQLMGKARNLIAEQAVWIGGFTFGYVCLFMGSLHPDTPVNVGWAALGRALIAFSLGGMVRQIHNHFKRSFNAIRFILASMMTFGIFAIQIFLHRSALPIAALVLAFFVLEVVTIDESRVPASILRICSFMGSMSYGVYAWHNNMIKIISIDALPFIRLNAGHQSVLDATVVVVVVLLMSVAATKLTNRFVEQPVQQRWGKARVNVN